MGWEPATGLGKAGGGRKEPVPIKVSYSHGQQQIASNCSSFANKPRNRSPHSRHACRSKSDAEGWAHLSPFLILQPQSARRR